MKSLLFFFLVFLANSLSIAQSDHSKTAIDNFRAYYNSGKYIVIFNNFSPEMKKDFSSEKTRHLLSDLKNRFGNIENIEYIDSSPENYESYKVVFEKETLVLNISLNTENQIKAFSIKSYKQPISERTVNALHNYPNKVAKAIVSKFKNFPNNTQLSIAVISNGKTDYYGILKTNNTIKAIENQHKIFEIGSITKVLTSSVLASLVKDKKIKLTDPIHIYYSFPLKGDHKINFQSLANHTSGLPRLPPNLNPKDENNPYQDYDKIRIETYLRNSLVLENSSEPIYSYSNLGVGILGYTLGLSQKTTFQKLLHQKIFKRYKMTNSFTNSRDLGKKLVKGLDSNGVMVCNWDFDALFAAGGVLSSAEDLAIFARAQFDPNNTELALTRKPTFKINKDMKIGLGWHILQSDQGKTLYWHNGGTGGYSSSITVNTDQKTAVVILSNIANFNEDIDDLCMELMEYISQK